jgi:hypothetical protein
MTDTIQAPSGSLPAGPDAVAAPSRGRRPAPVTILAAVQVLVAIGYLMSAAQLLAGDISAVQALFGEGSGVASDASIVVISVVSVLVVMTVVAVAAAVLLLRMRRLGWTITMLLAGWSLASQIYVYLTLGDLAPPIMILGVITVLYLNQRQVRTAFGIGRAADPASPELDQRA